MLNFMKYERSHPLTPFVSCSLLLGFKGIPRTMPPPPFLNVTVAFEWPHTKLKQEYYLSTSNIVDYIRVGDRVLLYFKYLRTPAPVFCKKQLIYIWGWLLLEDLKILGFIILKLFFIKRLTHSFTSLLQF